MVINRLFEQSFEWEQIILSKTAQTYTFVVASLFPIPNRAKNATMKGGPTLMEFDTTHCRGPLTKAKKQRCRANCLCLYSSGPRNITINCPHWVRRQVNQVNVCDIFGLDSLTTSTTLATFALSNLFKVLNKLDDVLTSKSNQIGSIWLSTIENS